MTSWLDAVCPINLIGPPAHLFLKVVELNNSQTTEQTFFSFFIVQEERAKFTEAAVLCHAQSHLSAMWMKSRSNSDIFTNSFTTFSAK